MTVKELAIKVKNSTEYSKSRESRATERNNFVKSLFSYIDSNGVVQIGCLMDVDVMRDSNLGDNLVVKDVI